MSFKILRCQSRADGIDRVFGLMKGAQDERMQVLIVPEKFGVSAERAMFESTQLRSVFNMDVTTFDRLADDYVIDKNIQFLSKSAGVMLVQKIALSIGKDLNILRESTHYNGFSENIFNTIMLLKSSNISPEQLLNASESCVEASKFKVLDIQKIYQEYENALRDRFIDSANKLDKLDTELAYDEKIKDTDFYIYAPKLTKQILKIVNTLAKNANSVFFLIEDNRDNTNYGLIRSLAENLGEFDEEQIEKNAFEKVIKYGQKCSLDNLEFYRAKDIRSEVENVCTQIASSGLRFRDNCVLVAGLDSYKTQIAEIMREFNIPYFIDTNQTLMTLSPIRVLMQLVDLTYEFRMDKVFAVVKSGLFNFDDEKVFNFELYTKKWGINERNFRGPNKPQDELFEDFSIVYNEFCNIFYSFKNKLVDCKNIGEMAETVLNFVTIANYDEKILDFSKTLESVGEMHTAKSYEQITKKIEYVVNQMVNILGLSTVSLKDFAVILKAGLDSVNIKTPPLLVDCVYVGDVSTSMVYKTQNMYVLGVVEGSFPVYNQDCGLLLDDEINAMRGVCEIDPTIRQVNIESKHMLLNNLVCTKNLKLSYPVSILSAPQTPATLLLEIMRSTGGIYGDTAEFIDCNGVNLLENVNEVAKKIVTTKRAEKIIREIDADVESMSISTIYLRVCGIINKLKLNFERASLSDVPRNVEKISVSQLETYFCCPYRNFLKYGLRLKENDDNTLKPVDIGNFMHKVAELYGQFIVLRKLRFIEDEQFFDNIIADAVKSIGYDDGGVNAKNISEQNLAIVENLKSSAKLMLRAINEQNKHSEFKISSVEDVIKFEIELKDKKLNFVGRVDRIDTFGDYVRIIDYKTGIDKFDLVNLKNGKKIQLFIYLGAVAKLTNKKPAGLYYFKIKDNFTSLYDDKSFLSTYKLNGVTLVDEQIVLAQDDTLSEEKLSSDIIPILFSKSYKSGNPSYDMRSSSVITEDKMAELIEYSNSIAKRGIEEIQVGNIQKSAYEKECTFCIYKGVLCEGCKRERKIYLKKSSDKETKQK